MSTTRSHHSIVWYAGYVVGWTLLIVAAGALIGVITFPIVGELAGSDTSPGSLAASGARQLGFLSFVWAPGIAIVMAFNRAYRERARPATPPAPASGQS